MAKGKKTGGRKAGTPNTISHSARQAFQLTFERLGGVDALHVWAVDNLTEFLRLYARLIPVEHVGEGGEGPIQSIVKHIYEP